MKHENQPYKVSGLGKNMRKIKKAKGKKTGRKKSYDLLINLEASFSPSPELFSFFLLHCFSIQVFLLSLLPDCV